MKTRLVFAILAISCFEVSFSGDAVNDVSDKATYEKKEREKSDFHRYEDWGMDWSDADMMQHPIDEGPRRVRIDQNSSILLYNYNLLFLEMCRKIAP